MNCPCGKEVPDPPVEGWKCPQCGRRLTFDEGGWPHFAKAYHFEEKSLDEAIGGSARERPARSRRASGLGGLGVVFLWGGCILLACVGYVFLKSGEGEVHIDWHKFSATEWALAVGLGALAGLVLQASYVFFNWLRRRGT